jgi:starch synthase
MGFSFYFDDSMPRPLKIMMVVSECTPFAKTGGLADVAGALPKALKALGHDVRVIMPYYSRIVSAEQYGLKPLNGIIDVPLGFGQHSARIFETRLPNSDVPVYMVEHPGFFDRPELYRTMDGDYDDNHYRFIFFDRAVMGACKHLEFKPDVFHCNDWHTVLVPAYLKTLYTNDAFFNHSASLFTIHNLAYQGLFGREVMELTGLPNHTWNAEGLEFYGHMNFMKAGLVYSDLVSTVSPRYAQEIQTPEFGFGLEGVLQRRAADLLGITNGIDTDVWDPSHDPYLAVNYGPDSLDRKAEVKAAFLAENKLSGGPDVPLLGLISRLDSQKGFDLLAEIIDYVMNFDLRLVVLGTGDRRFHEMFERIRANYPDKAAVHLTFNNELAHKIQGASDIFLMPSKFEPCGLNQLVAMRYGTVPVVRATGGLADTVTDYNPKTGEGTGFAFWEYSSMPFFNAIKRALETYSDKQAWRKIQLAGMAQDHSWTASARRYEEVYRRAMEKRGVKAE